MKNNFLFQSIIVVGSSFLIFCVSAPPKKILSPRPLGGDVGSVAPSGLAVLKPVGPFSLSTASSAEAEDSEDQKLALAQLDEMIASGEDFSSVASTALPSPVSSGNTGSRRRKNTIVGCCSTLSSAPAELADGDDIAKFMEEMAATVSDRVAGDVVAIAMLDEELSPKILSGDCLNVGGKYAGRKYDEVVSCKALLRGHRKIIMQFCSRSSELIRAYCARLDALRSMGPRLSLKDEDAMQDAARRLLFWVGFKVMLSERMVESVYLSTSKTTAFSADEFEKMGNLDSRWIYHQAVYLRLKQRCGVAIQHYAKATATPVGRSSKLNEALRAYWIGLGEGLDACSSLEAEVVKVKHTSFPPRATVLPEGYCKPGVIEWVGYSDPANPLDVAFSVAALGKQNWI